VDKARKRCTFVKTPSSSKLATMGPLPQGHPGKAMTLNLRPCISSPQLLTAPTNGTCRSPSGSKTLLRQVTRERDVGSPTSPPRTPSTSSSGAEDSDLTIDDEDDEEFDDETVSSERDDDVGPFDSPALTFAELKVRR
jgi:hypothetical protein